MKIFLWCIVCLLFFNVNGQVVSTNPSSAFRGQTVSTLIKLAPGVIQAGNPPSTTADVYLKQGDSIIYTNAFTSAQIYPGAPPYDDSLSADFTIPSYAKPGWYEVHVRTYDAFNAPVDNKLDYGFVVRLVGSCPVPFNVSADTVTADGTAEIISWDPAVTADIFRVRYRESGTTNYFYKDVPGAGGVFFDTIFGLYPGALYEVDVSTICGGISSTYSGPVETFTTLPQTFSCLVPYGISFSSVTNTSAQVSWTNYVTADTFRILYYLTGTNQYQYLDVNGSGPHTATISNLKPGSVYDVRIRSKCLGAGNSYSYKRQLSTLSTPVACGIPWNTDTSGVTNSATTIHWTPFVSADEFRIRYSVFGSTNYSYLNSPGTSGNSATITGLMPNTTYQYQVSSICSGSGSGYSPSRVFTTGNAPVSCGKPYDLITTNVSNASADISWTNMVTADSFLIRYYVDGSTNYNWKKIVGTSYNTTLTGLVPLTNYRWQVRSLCSGAPSPYSLPVLFGTPARLSQSATLFYTPEIFPNPANSNVRVRFSAIEVGKILLRVSDLSGRILIESAHLVQEGRNEQEINVSSLSSGIYFIELYEKEFYARKKLVLSR